MNGLRADAEEEDAGGEVAVEVGEEEV